MGKLKAIFTIPELRQKILLTLLFLAIYRVGYQIPLPFTDQRQMYRGVSTGGPLGNVLVVTAGIEEADSQQLIRAGIAGIFMKHSSAAMLAEGIRHVMAGKVWFDQEVLLSAVAADTKPRLSPAAERLTQREKQVLSSVFEGLSNKEIAGRLGVSETSVKATLQQLFSKTGVRTRTQLVRIALEQYKNQF